jgi:hypothetical protein
MNTRQRRAGYRLSQDVARTDRRFVEICEGMLTEWYDNKP